MWPLWSLSTSLPQAFSIGVTLFPLPAFFVTFFNALVAFFLLTFFFPFLPGFIPMHFSNASISSASILPFLSKSAAFLHLISFLDGGLCLALALSFIHAIIAFR